MHYRNGREAKNGDQLVKLDFETGKILAHGVLHDATPGNDYCNGNIAPITAYPTAAILKEKGLHKRPEGK